MAILGIACLGQTVLVSANGVWDGNFLLFFYKSPAHSSPYCGNGITQPEFGEQCDFNSLFPLADPW